MLSQTKLAALEEAGYQYIVGYRLRAASKKLQQQALAPEGYTSFSASGGSAEGKQEEVGRWKQMEQQDCKGAAQVPYGARRIPVR